MATRVAVISNSASVDSRFQFDLIDMTYKYLIDLESPHHKPRFLHKVNQQIDEPMIRDISSYITTFKGRLTVILMLGEYDISMCSSPMAIAGRIEMVINCILKKRTQKIHIIVVGLIPPHEQFLRKDYDETDAQISLMLGRHKARKRLTFVRLSQHLREKKAYRQQFELSDYGLEVVIAKLAIALSEVPDRH
jgi:hypothetical protein